MNQVDVSRWTRIHSERKHPYWWGIIGLIIIESTVIGIFLASFFYLWIIKISEAGNSWTPNKENLPSLFWPTINTVLLFFCGWTMWYGGVVMKKNRPKSFVWLVIWCCLAAGLVLFFRWNQLKGLPYTWNDHAYGSFIWTLSGFHFMHVLAGILGTAAIGWLSYRGYYDEKRMLGVQIDTMYWYYIVAGWLPIYLTLYWVPRLFS